MDVRRMTLVRPASGLLVALMLSAGVGCSKDKDPQPTRTDTPPPGKPTARGDAPPGADTAAEAPKGEVCKAGGGENPDTVSAAFFPRKVDAYCIDPEGEVRSYGEQAKLSMDEVCTTAFDGECEIYKRFGLKRVVALSYVDDAGKGVNVEIVLSRFADAEGAYGMFTKRVVADGDPAGEGVPKPLQVGTAGAIGTGRAYFVRGAYMAELQYNSENETPEALTASSSKALPALAKAIADKLPGDTTLPASAKALPTDKLVPNGIQYFTKEVPGFGNVGPAAFGFYDDAGTRVRVLSVTRADATAAKAVFAKLKGQGETVTGVGEEAVVVPIKSSPTATATSFVIGRRGAQLFAVGSEEFVVSKDPAKLVAAEALTERAKALLPAP